MGDQRFESKDYYDSLENIIRTGDIAKYYQEMKEVEEYITKIANRIKALGGDPYPFVREPWLASLPTYYINKTPHLKGMLQIVIGFKDWENDLRAGIWQN